MLGDIFLGLIILYIIGVILHRLFVSLLLIAELGWGGAFFAFLWNVWSLAKLAFVMLIIILIMRGC